MKEQRWKQNVESEASSDWAANVKRSTDAVRTVWCVIAHAGKGESEASSDWAENVSLLFALYSILFHIRVIGEICGSINLIRVIRLIRC